MPGALILPAAVAAWWWAHLRHAPPRIALLRALVVCGAAAVLITELLSLWRAIDRANILLCWCLVLAVALVLGRRTEVPRLPRPSPFTAACLAAIGCMAAIIAWTALLSPPNSADALSYHLPRVIYWIQNRSVAFFPTSYLNQIMLQPLAEYIMLHTYLLAGGDAFVNLVQWTAYVGSVIGVSSIAASLGLDHRGQAVVALFCATLPNAILQASGAKNDAVLALWLVSTVLFTLRWVKSREKLDLAFLALSAGLALGTKATAYLFAPAFLLAAALAAGGLSELRIAAPAVIAGVLAINLPQYARNYELSGSPLGFDSAQGDGFFRWRNDQLGWKPAVSNAVRNTAEQLGGRNERWNGAVYAAALRFHELLGLDPQDPRTTWPWSRFEPPRNANHEANANNRWHLLILAVAFALAVLRRDKRWLYYALGPLAGFAAFCFYLKWQPFFARLELPLFVIAAPLGAMAITRVRPVLLQAAVCLLLVSNARLALTENWTRPLKSLRTAPREAHYFNDLGQWNNRESYLAAVDLTAATGCNLVGIDISQNHVEYPFQALLREKNPVVRFVHVGVENASAKYAQEDRPCAVLCLDCAGVDAKQAKYAAVGRTHTMGRFLLFTGKELEAADKRR